MKRAHTEAERIKAFWDKVDKSGSCWNWLGDKYPNGYGRVWNGDRKVLTHRFAFELECGPIGDLCVLHRCDNKGCVNPAHLFLGTPKDNTQNCISKGRFNPPRGENHPYCKLKDTQVSKIRARMKTGHYPQREIASEYGVCQQHISDIVSWKYRRFPPVIL